MQRWNNDNPPDTPISSCRFVGESAHKAYAQRQQRQVRALAEHQRRRRNVEVLKVTIEDKKQLLILTFYFGNTKSNGDSVIVRLTKQKGKWRITK